jgi:N,N'-diacetyllegionaminate synthase
MKIDITKKTLIIAEAGVNHNGKIDIALDLVNAASDSGADIIKFQTFKANSLILKNTKKTQYQIKNTGSNNNQFQMLKLLEMSDLMHDKIVNQCLKKNIEFLSSAFDIETLGYLIKLGIKRIKIPSGEITNLPYLEKASTFLLPIIMSTGMSNLNEIKHAYKVLKTSGMTNDMLTFLHCTSNYPAKLKSINLNAMKIIQDTFNVSVGYSDHSSVNETSIAAVSLGAKVIEKHITLDKNLNGPDHKASLNPYEFKNLVNSIRVVEKILGTNLKKANSEELKNALLVRKSIIASKYIKNGELFTSNNLTTKRPGTGVNPMLWYKIIGQKATQNYKVNEMIKYEE